MDKKPRKKQRFDINQALSGIDRVNEKVRMGNETIQNISGIQPTFPQPLLPNTSIPFDLHVALFLDSIRSKAKEVASKQKGIVEVEVRIGHICPRNGTNPTRFKTTNQQPTFNVLKFDDMRRNNAQFRSSVFPQDFLKFKGNVERLAKPWTVNSNEVVRIYKDNVRAIEDQKTFKFKYQTKQTIEVLNIYLPHCPYDLRISVAVESELLDWSLPELQNPESIRIRKRQTFRGERLFGFLFDMTEVSDGYLETGEESFEVEMELDTNQTSKWVEDHNTSTTPSQDFNNPPSTSSLSVAQAIWKATTIFFLPNFREPARLFLDDQLTKTITDTISQSCGNNGGPGRSFMGTMPVGFGRRFLGQVSNPINEYFVSEKTDGVRFILVFPNPGWDDQKPNQNYPVLIDRTNSIFTLPGLITMKGLLPESTVLDGELVLNRKDNLPYFVVFDIMSLGQERVSTLPFAKRLAMISSAISEFSINATKQNRLSLVLPLLRKIWHPAKDIQEIFSKVRTTNHNSDSPFVNRVYDDKGKRLHFTDGVVFCPNTPYVVGTCQTYYKWKWCDQITIDLRAEYLNNGSISLYASGRGDEIDLSSQIFLTENAQRVIKESTPQPVVVELGFNRSSGLWDCKAVRNDKTRGNFILTVIDALTQLAESISESELITHLTQNGDYIEKKPPLPFGLFR